MDLLISKPRSIAAAMCWVKAKVDRWGCVEGFQKPAKFLGLMHEVPPGRANMGMVVVLHCIDKPIAQAPCVWCSCMVPE